MVRGGSPLLKSPKVFIRHKFRPAKAQADINKIDMIGKENFLLNPEKSSRAISTAQL
jgi:hypothetical protein